MKSTNLHPPWIRLYVQDRCPMCHQTLWPQATSSEETEEAHENGHYPVGEAMQPEQHAHQD